MQGRPTRVDNEAKACLDDVALNLQRSSDAKLALVGNEDAKEQSRKDGKRHASPAAVRAINAKDYLVTDKGIDASRIMVYTGTDDAKTVTTTLVPSGATNPVANDTAVDESTVKPVSRATAAASTARRSSSYRTTTTKADWVPSQSAFVLCGSSPSGYRRCVFCIKEDGIRTGTTLNRMNCADPVTSALF